MINKKLISIGTALIITGSSFAFIVPPAYGKPTPVIVSADPNLAIRHIRFGDLNLASASGERTLHHRVVKAVGSLCDQVTGGIDGAYLVDSPDGKCRTSAWRQATPQIARATQSAREMASTGLSPVAAAAVITINFSN